MNENKIQWVQKEKSRLKFKNALKQQNIVRTNTPLCVMEKPSLLI